jgi:diguanylate cyclase (GGDEF)-like protein
MKNRMTLIARLYVGVMFGVLVAIGACALYAYERDQSPPLVEQLIVCLTFVGIILVSGLPVLLGIHRRAVARSSAENFALFERASLIDNLTRIGNRRAFDEDFAREVSRAKRNHYPLALALIDVDHFKLLNHHRGVNAGDDVLMLLANRLGMLRQEDRAYRVGSDEFAVLLVDTEPQAARIALARLRKEAQKGLLGATISIGYANLAADVLDVESYELAVMALCEAKRRGPSGMVCFEHVIGEIIISAPSQARQEAVMRTA